MSEESSLTCCGWTMLPGIRQCRGPGTRHVRKDRGDTWATRKPRSAKRATDTGTLAPTHTHTPGTTPAHFSPATRVLPRGSSQPRSQRWEAVPALGSERVSCPSFQRKRVMEPGVGAGSVPTSSQARVGLLCRPVLYPSCHLKHAPLCLEEVLVPSCHHPTGTASPGWHTCTQISSEAHILLYFIIPSFSSAGD